MEESWKAYHQVSVDDCSFWDNSIGEDKPKKPRRENKNAPQEMSSKRRPKKEHRQEEKRVVRGMAMQTS